MIPVAEFKPTHGEWPYGRFTALSYGGGTNSTALLIGLWERHGRLPELVMFADTGGEMPHTYEAVARMQPWCEERGARFVAVSNADPEGERHGHKSLEDECHRNVTLPSLAYGNKGCSAKWKRHPMDRFLRDDAEAQACLESGEAITRLLGIDAEEAHRSASLEKETWPAVYRRPLIGWGWGRDECLEAIERAGLPSPGKSACWFCPAAKKHEVIALAKEHPDLFRRAVEMEHIAATTTTVVRGLGRNWSWEELVAADRAQLKLFPDPTDEACGCYDGETQ